MAPSQGIPMPRQLVERTLLSPLHLAPALAPGLQLHLVPDRLDFPGIKTGGDCQEVDDTQLPEPIEEIIEIQRPRTPRSLRIERYRAVVVDTVM